MILNRFFGDHLDRVFVPDWRDNACEWYVHRLVSEGKDYSVTSIRTECPVYIFHKAEIPTLDGESLKNWLNVIACLLDLDDIVPDGPA